MFQKVKFKEQLQKLIGNSATTEFSLSATAVFRNFHLRIPPLLQPLSLPSLLHMPCKTLSLFHSMFHGTSPPSFASFVGRKQILSHPNSQKVPTLFVLIFFTFFAKKSFFFESIRQICQYPVMNAKTGRPPHIQLQSNVIISIALLIPQKQQLLFLFG